MKKWQIRKKNLFLNLLKTILFEICLIILNNKATYTILVEIILEKMSMPQFRIFESLYVKINATNCSYNFLVNVPLVILIK